MTLYSLIRFSSNSKKIIVFLSILCVSSKYTTAQNSRPNIIYIMADDLGYADLSTYGRKDYTTPNLDKLASQGIKFINAYAGGPLCTPTRTAFMTGRFPARTPVGLYEPLKNTPKDSLMGLRHEQTSMATLLKRAGYETILIGKWHLGYLPEYSPQANGFTEFFGFKSGATDYVAHKSRRHTPDLYENEIPIKKEGYFTDLLRDRAIQYISKEHKKPFFLSIQFNAPHWPWQGPADKPYSDTMNWTMHGSPVIFASMMKSLDNAIGEIVKAVDDANLSANTIIFFTSDNGGEKYSDMGGYTGLKLQLWEGGIRVPAFIRWPGRIKPGSTTEQVAITMDWTATILSLAGTKADPALPLDGQNLIPVCLGEKSVFDRTLYWRLFQHTKQKAMRDGNWKYLQNEQGEYLFNLIQDPGEKNNLKEKFSDEFEKLKKKYEDWEKSVLTPVPL